MEIFDSGTASLTGAAETNIRAEITEAGSFVLTCDLAAMVNGDEISLSIYEKVLSGGTSRMLYRGNYTHAQGWPIVKSPPIDSAYGVTFKWQRNAGADPISVPWRIDKL